MADDIDLRWIARNTMSLAVAEVCNHAADEIERLRAAGDALVAAIRNHDLHEEHITAWQAARRG